MCSPLGVRTSFSWRLPFERPLDAVGELEEDDGIHISYANRRNQQADLNFFASSAPQPGAAWPHGPGFRCNEMNNIYNLSRWDPWPMCSCMRGMGFATAGHFATRMGDGELVPGCL